MQLTRRAVVVGQAIVLDVEEIYGEGRNREKDSHDKDPTCASSGGLWNMVASF